MITPDFNHFTCVRYIVLLGIASVKCTTDVCKITLWKSAIMKMTGSLVRKFFTFTERDESSLQHTDRQ